MCKAWAVRLVSINYCHWVYLISFSVNRRVDLVVDQQSVSSGRYSWVRIESWSHGAGMKGYPNYGRLFIRSISQQYTVLWCNLSEDWNVRVLLYFALLPIAIGNMRNCHLKQVLTARRDCRPPGNPLRCLALLSYGSVCASAVLSAPHIAISFPRPINVSMTKFSTVQCFLMWCTCNPQASAYSHFLGLPSVLYSGSRQLMTWRGA